MDVVSRAFSCFAALIMLLLAGSPVNAVPKDDEEKAMIERSNQRCDDFYRYRREMDEQDNRREMDAQEIKKVREAHDKALETAREEYVKNRKKQVVDPNLEKQWDEQQLADKKQHELEARRYAERKAAVEDAIRKGCHVPEAKEYDLED
jgi:hypothetical protein